MRTTRMVPRFVVKKYADGTPWIAIEAGGPPEAGFPTTWFGLDLAQGTSLDKAQDIATFLQQSITQFACTTQP